MSRTDKTRPFRVKQDEYRVLRPRLNDEPRHNRYVWCLTYEWWRGEFRCGCGICSADTWRSRKQSRAEAKRQIRDELRQQ